VAQFNAHHRAPGGKSAARSVPARCQVESL
jgi:hypothetical protein